MLTKKHINSNFGDLYWSCANLRMLYYTVSAKHEIDLLVYDLYGLTEEEIFALKHEIDLKNKHNVLHLQRKY